MANTVGSNPISQGTLPGAAQAIPTLQRQTATQAESQVPGFAQAFAGEALTPTALGDISSKVISSTGMKLGEIQGAALAEKNSNIKNLLPALTKSDQAFADAYSSRSQQILGQQANQLINKSQEQAASAGQLSEGVIGSFQQSASQGIDDILKNAPDSIRNQMMYSYQNQVSDTAHKMRMQMISDQQAQQKQLQQAHNNTEVSNSFQNAFSNGAEAGKVNLDLFTQDLNRQKSAGTITPKEYETLKDSATLNFYTGVSSRGVSDARANEQLPESERNKKIPTVGKYLSQVHDSLPKSMSELEKMSVVKNVVEYAKEAHAAEAQNNQIITSELGRALADGTTDRAMIAQAEQDLPPAEFNNFMTKYWTNRSKKDAENEAVRNVANNFDNPLAANSGTPDQINKAFYALVDSSMNKNPGQDPMVAKVGIAKSGGVEVPAFSKELDTMLTRGTPPQVYAAMRAYDEVRDYNPQNVKSVSKQGQSMGAMMNDLHEVAGLPLDEAYTQAKEAIFNQTPEQLEMRELQYNEEVKAHLSSSQEITSKAQKLLNVPYFTNVPNMPYVANTIMRLRKDYFMMSGSTSIADDLTKKALQKSYGETHANGSKQKVFMPIESLAGIGTDAPEVVHADMEDNIATQLEATKAAYDSGNIDWYYRVGDRVKGQVKVDRVFRGVTKTELPTQGLVEKGNIDLFNRPQVKNKDGVSTVFSMSIGTDKGEVLIPRVSDSGKILSEEDAIKLYRDTGKNLGIFKSIKDATTYAEALHSQQDEFYSSQVVQPLSVSIAASNNLQRTQNQAAPYAGYYDISLIDSNGFPAPIATVSTGPIHQFAYRPDLARIKAMYAYKHNKGMSAQELERSAIKDFFKSHAEGLRKKEQYRQDEQVTMNQLMGGV